jgi:F0F1-type ATP synthase assembly protein I
MMPGDEPRFGQMGYLLALGQVGIEMVVPIGVGIALDLWLHTAPVFILIGVVVGLVGGLVHMLAILKRMDKSESEKPPQESS